jgi:hypothetical protein
MSSRAKCGDQKLDCFIKFAMTYLSLPFSLLFLFNVIASEVWRSKTRLLITGLLRHFVPRNDLLFNTVHTLRHNSLLRDRTKDILLGEIFLCERIHIWYTFVQYLQLLPSMFLLQVDYEQLDILLHDVLLHERCYGFLQLSLEIILLLRF